LVAQLADTKISTGDLIGLRVGDIITTEKDTNTPILISVEGVPKYHARVGAFKGRKAIRIDEPLAPPTPPAPKTATANEAGGASKASTPAATSANSGPAKPSAAPQASPAKKK
jgi:flagellar motor switch protein FliM